MDTKISRINRRDAPSEEQLKNTAWSSVKFDVGVDQEWLVEIRSDEFSALRTKSAGLQNEKIAESVLLKNMDVTLADDDAMIDTKLKPMIKDDIVIIESNTSEDIRIDDAVSIKDTELDITTTLPRVVTLPAELSIGERMIELLYEFWRILIGALLIVLGILFWFSRRAERSDDENLTEVYDILDANKEDESPIERLVSGGVSSELHDAYTMMEVSTKLDLARAYVDMDGDVARSILGEVLDEGDEDQKKLAGFYSLMHRKGALLMLSNSDPHVTDAADDFFDDLYEDFNIHRVVANRTINSDPGKRGAITEILVTNYRVKG